MDALFFTALVRELSREIVGAKIQKVDQPSASEIWIHLRKPGRNLRLSISADGETASMFLASRHKEEPLPMAAPNFCMLLRRRIAGGRVEQVIQPDMERLCRIVISSGDELGNPVRYTLVCEIMGRRSNILLVDEVSRIMGVLRPVGEAQNRFRQLLPGYTYVSPPPISKPHPAAVVPGSFLPREDNKNAGVVLSSVSGLGPYSAALICLAAGLAPDDSFYPSNGEALARACRQVWDEASHASHGLCCTTEAGRSVCHVVAVPGAQGCLRFDSISAALEHYVSTAKRERAFISKHRSLRQSVQSRLERVKRRLTLREGELRDAGSREHNRLMGDLVLTYMVEVTEALKARTTPVRLTDPATQESIDVSLDFSKDAAQNAQLFYRRYAKARAAEKSLTPQIESDRDEVAYLESILAALDLAHSTEDVYEIELEVGQQQQETKKVTAREPTRLEPLRFLSSAGEEILVGRNNRQNEMVTFRLAKPTDVWFHVKALPGAHVLLRAERGTPKESSLLEAASLAALYSAGKQSSKVEVDYTQAKHVKKKPGGKPGMVIYENYKTLLARPADAQEKANSTRP